MPLLLQSVSVDHQLNELLASWAFSPSSLHRTRANALVVNDDAVLDVEQVHRSRKSWSSGDPMFNEPVAFIGRAERLSEPLMNCSARNCRPRVAECVHLLDLNQLVSQLAKAGFADLARADADLLRAWLVRIAAPNDS